MKSLPLSVRSTLALAASALLALPFAAGTAQAFSSPSSYLLEPEVGGGGGRWFTGSPADGYGCDVCHEGGEAADLSVSGLPSGRAIPGSSYEVTISWPFEVEHVAMVVELTDEFSQPVGELSLKAPTAMQLDELCGPDFGGFPATELHQTEDGRQLVSLIDCGARVVRFQWTAPQVFTGTAWLSAGLVVSNEDAAATGDGVTLVHLPVAGTQNSQATRELLEGSCSVNAAPGGRGASAIGYGLIVSCVLVLMLRARRSGIAKGAVRCRTDRR
ncbi:MAG: hypothetical protein OEZ06_13250 [Myxococcales bacterium]|nr:hypothetical protein [Myxococcales bacterium]